MASDRSRSRSPRERTDIRGRKAAGAKKPKKHIQGMEDAELIEVNNDGECGWASIGLGNSIASIKGHNYDATTRKNKHQLIREKKKQLRGYHQAKNVRIRGRKRKRTMEKDKGKGLESTRDWRSNQGRWSTNNHIRGIHGSNPTKEEKVDR